MGFRGRPRALAWAVASNVLGGSAYFAISVALEAWPPALLVLTRIALALPIFAWAMPPRPFARATRADFGRLLLIGVVGFAAPLWVSAVGLAGTDSSSGAILIGLEPVVLVVLARLFLGERMNPRQGLAIGVAVLGAIVVVSGGDLEQLFVFQGNVRSNAILALPAFLWSVYTVAAKPTLERVPPEALSFATGLVAVLCLLPVAAVELDGFVGERAWALRPLMALSFLVLGVSFLAVFAWNRALREVSANDMAILLMLQPLTGVLLGTASGEPAGWPKVVGGGLVLVAVWLSARSQPSVG